jgi:hypothetical protein
MHLKLSNLVPSRSGKMKNFRKLFCVTVGILCLNNYIPPIECEYIYLKKFPSCVLFILRNVYYRFLLWLILIGAKLILTLKLI